MNPIDPKTIESLQSLHEFSHEAFWFILPLLILVFAKSFIEEFVGGVLWKIGGSYDNYDIVVIDGEYSRIMHVGWLKTAFNVYIIKDNKVVGGMIMSVLNNELRRMRIKEPMTLLDLPETLRDISK